MAGLRDRPVSSPAYVSVASTWMSPAENSTHTCVFPKPLFLAKSRA